MNSNTYVALKAFKDVFNQYLELAEIDERHKVTTSKWTVDDWLRQAIYIAIYEKKGEIQQLREFKRD